MGKPAVIDLQPTLIGRLYTVRALRPTDREELYKSAKDPLMWEQHTEPDLYRQGVFNTHFENLLKLPGAVALTNSITDQPIGLSCFYPDFVQRSEFSIGCTFIARPLWGGPANYQIKSLMLNHLFRTEHNVWFHVDRYNLRARRSIKKLGAYAVGECTADLFLTGRGQQQLLRYCINQTQWERIKEEHS